MKIIERKIFHFQENDFFRPIRDKVSFARLLVCAVELLLLESQEEGTSTMKLIVDKMSRLFFYKDNKYFSVAFPFTVILDDNDEVKEVKTYSGKKIDFSNTSGVRAILDSEDFSNHPSLIDFPILPETNEESGIYFLEEILQFEPSYIRYDNDPNNQNGKLHPLNHLDINYSQYGTYKLGLKSSIDKDYFENLQNTNTACSFVID